MYILIGFELHVPILNKLCYLCSALSPKKLSLLSLTGSHSVYTQPVGQLSSAEESRGIPTQTVASFHPLLCCSRTLACKFLLHQRPQILPSDFSAQEKSFLCLGSPAVGKLSPGKNQQTWDSSCLLPFSQGSQSALPVFQSMKPIASDFVQSDTVVVEDQRISSSSLEVEVLLSLSFCKHLFRGIIDIICCTYVKCTIFKLFIYSSTLGLQLLHVGPQFPDQGSNLHPLNFKVDSQPLDHQGRTQNVKLLSFYLCIFPWNHHHDKEIKIMNISITPKFPLVLQN